MATQTETEQPTPTATPDICPLTRARVANLDSCQPTPTPRPRALIALGDSVSSGHHQNVCNAHYSKDFSYPYMLWQMLKAKGRGTWVYFPHSNSGATTETVITSGSTSCHDVYHHTLAAAESDLRHYKGANNVVVITAGANDTGWTSFILGMALRPASLRGWTPAQCRAYFRDKWRTPLGERHIPEKIMANVQTIVDGLGAADPRVTIYWTSYYNMAGTAGSILLPGPGGVPISHEIFPAACEDAVNIALGELHSWIHTGFSRSKYGANVRWIDISGRDSPLYRRNQQPFQASPLPVSWPHPAKGGHAVIAQAIYSKIRP